jgi:hypothetical protein
MLKTDYFYVSIDNSVASLVVFFIYHYFMLFISVQSIVWFILTVCTKKIQNMIWSDQRTGPPPNGPAMSIWSATINEIQQQEEEEECQRCVPCACASPSRRSRY